jgi:hypothetical protein
LLVLPIVVLGLGAVPAASQTTTADTPPARHFFHRPHLHHLQRSVPTGMDTGRPGTANSANPAPNVPPIQTPQDPLRR